MSHKLEESSGSSVRYVVVVLFLHESVRSCFVSGRKTQCRYVFLVSDLRNVLISSDLDIELTRKEGKGK